ncbi:hypothetical protein L227DRAFT_580088 [Lentinus tigrinus ALCF2SS1-6]|uniref:Uncharacterized protein n=1 Tax=Lentinus tigrinus ALCF2SS1-6 TaxID=1328759 RepID=A0A5C2RT91_9APHY|nr:hypothetical protein L227DRAFT_580088 [Lentinus tigrinus ALCF2SS1-6]
MREIPYTEAEKSTGESHDRTRARTDASTGGFERRHHAVIARWAAGCEIDVSCCRT